MNFVAIDFETATSDRNSPCEIGLTFVENWEIKETRSWLIKPKCYPYFSPVNISIHGIRPEHVINEPEFDEIWQEIKPFLEQKVLIAHNASYDFSVLQKTLETYQLAIPSFDYLCSMLISKKVWVGLPEYGLKPLCLRNNIEFTHHRAGNDTEATAKLALKAFQTAGVSSMNEFKEKFNLQFGKIFDKRVISSKSVRNKSNVKNVKLFEGDATKNNPGSIFYGKTVVFTGTLSSMVRGKAKQIIADIGRNVKNKCTHGTDFLIVGQQDNKVVGEDGLSESHLKAIELIENGSNVEILSEEDFYAIIST
jgi:DNA polymerase-3 subunit epsilon